MIEKLQSKFSDYHQQLFLSSFYCYLKYDKLNDFVIDLDDIWEWLGFTTVDKDIKFLLTRSGEQELEYALMNGKPKEEDKDDSNTSKETSKSRN